MTVLPHFINKPIALLLLISILMSCKKSITEDEHYTLTATIMDFDNNTAIAGAKVYVKEGVPLVAVLIDSAISDANGRVSFTYRREGGFKFLYATKANYLDPRYIAFYYTDYNDRNENLYLARPSFINVTVHKNTTYLPLDTVYIQVRGDNNPLYGQNTNYRSLHRDKADAPDKVFNLQTVYGQNNGTMFIGSQKLYFKTDIIRSGLVISTKTDSTNVIQFGTQNSTLYY